MEIEGIIKMELPVRSGVSAQTGKPWRIASYVLETISSYPKRMVFDVMDGDENRIARLNIKAGRRMKIWFDIDAHEYQGRWYNQIRAFDARETGYQPQNNGLQWQQTTNAANNTTQSSNGAQNG